MSENMIRKLCHNDIPTIIESLRDEKFDCCELNDFWTIEELEKWLDNKHDICAGFFIDGVLVGFCLTHVSYDIGKVYLENIYVSPQYRGLGIAKKLVDYVVREYSLLNNGKTLRFVALVEISNAPAITTLKKGGFSIGDKMLWIQKNVQNNI